MATSLHQDFKNYHPDLSLQLNRQQAVKAVVAFEMLISNYSQRLLHPSVLTPPRIGHGFAIHRMVPLREAEQPIIIGGYGITHEDKKWLDVDGKYAKEPKSIFSLPHAPCIFAHFPKSVTAGIRFLLPSLSKSVIMIHW